jgi:hypothetical protein
MKQEEALIEVTENGDEEKQMCHLYQVEKILEIIYKKHEEEMDNLLARTKLAERYAPNASIGISREEAFAKTYNFFRLRGPLENEVVGFVNKLLFEIYNSIKPHPLCDSCHNLSACNAMGYGRCELDQLLHHKDSYCSEHTKMQDA